MYLFIYLNLYPNACFIKIYGESIKLIMIEHTHIKDEMICVNHINIKLFLFFLFCLIKQCNNNYKLENFIETTTTTKIIIIVT